MLVIHDTTSVLESDPPRRLVLEARARPLVIARVDIRFEPEDGGTLVVLDETATGGLVGALPPAVTDAPIHLRNHETVRRLKRLAELGWRLRRAAD
jgi:hypothetical protein